MNSITRKPNKEEREKWEAHIKKYDDEKYPLAVDAVLESKKLYQLNEAYTSVSFLQRKVRVGYSQGQRLIDKMVQENILEIKKYDNYIEYKIIG